MVHAIDQSTSEVSECSYAGVSTDPLSVAHSLLPLCTRAAFCLRCMARRHSFVSKNRCSTHSFTTHNSGLGGATAFFLILSGTRHYSTNAWSSVFSSRTCLADAHTLAIPSLSASCVPFAPHVYTRCYEPCLIPSLGSHQISLTYLYMKCAWRTLKLEPLERAPVLLYSKPPFSLSLTQRTSSKTNSLETVIYNNHVYPEA